jgi:hypothetical protein
MPRGRDPLPRRDEPSILHKCYIAFVAYDVELSDECVAWFECLSEGEPLSVARVVDVLEEGQRWQQSGRM